MNAYAALRARWGAPPDGSGPPFSAAARTVLEARYLARDDAGVVVETPREMVWRVARAVAEAEATWGGEPEARAREFFALLEGLGFLPNSPTLMNAGRPDGQLSACFVLPVEDDLGAIFDALKGTAQIHQTGGGTGFAFSRIRPRGDRVGDRGRASGPLAFMRVFDAATGAIHQGGVRRGANMGVLRIDHPDIVEFIEAKRRPGELSHFNISVAVTDAFMEALAAGTPFALRNPRDGGVERTVAPEEVWLRLVEAAWATGDPGLIFIDRVNAAQPTPALGAIESTNPCGELPLLPYESCNLGSIDVAKHLAGGDVDWARLAATVALAVRFLDDVIEVNAFPFPAIAEATRRTRKIGLGVMGWADALIELGIPYASPRARDLAERLAAFILSEAREASRTLATERGPFPAWEGSRWEREGVPGPLRNATVTTVAPTGTIALLAGCSSGIEPLYALAHVRRALDGAARIEVVHPALERLAREQGCWSEELEQHVARTGTIGGRSELPQELRALLQTAHEVGFADHVRMQAAFQRHNENAVSKTINLPAEATVADVRAAYELAYAEGCKGITVYRDGCRAGQVLSHPAACGGPECVDPGLGADAD